MANQRAKYLLSMAGEYGVCSELCKRDYAVSMTFGNAKAVDVVVSITDPNGCVHSRFVEVKTTRSHRFVTGFFQKYDANSCWHPDYWVLVYIDSADVSHYYVLSHQEMGDTQMKRNGMTSWQKIVGVDNVPLSLVSCYENQWNKII